MTVSPTRWTPLVPGDLIDIIAPSAGIEPHQVNRVSAFVKAFGFTPRIPKDICGTTPYYAHEDSERLAQVSDALRAPDSRAVWCVRGGYGATRLIPSLLKLPVPDRCKVMIGFSDITALHVFLNQHWHWPSLHAPVLFQAIENLVDEASLSALKNVLLGNVPELSYTPLVPLNNPAKQEKTLHSQVVGGNLSLLTTSLGTVWQLNAAKKILFIEEVSERGYRIDRMFTHLSQAGCFDRADAVLLGDFTGGDETNGGNFVNHALTSFASQCTMPVLQYKMFGHGKRNLPLPLYSPATLTLGKHPSLICHTGAML